MKTQGKLSRRLHQCRPCSVSEQGFFLLISNRQALSLLEQISAYLLTYKKYRAQLVLSNYRRLTPRNGKYTVEIQQQREEFIKLFLATKANNLKG